MFKKLIYACRQCVRLSFVENWVEEHLGLSLRPRFVHSQYKNFQILVQESQPSSVPLLPCFCHDIGNKN